MMIMEQTTMNFNKMSMNSDLHSELLIEAITLIKTNELFFGVEQDIARDILDCSATIRMSGLTTIILAG